MSEYYVKYEDNGIVYYFHNSVDMSYNNFLKLKTSSVFSRLLLADFIFNREDNKLIKCRESLEFILDKFTGIENEW